MTARARRLSNGIRRARDKDVGWAETGEREEYSRATQAERLRNGRHFAASSACLIGSAPAPARN